MKASTFDEVPTVYEAMASKKERLCVSDVMTQKLAKSLCIGEDWQIGYRSDFEKALAEAVVVEWKTFEVGETRMMYAWRELDFSKQKIDLNQEMR